VHAVKLNQNVVILNQLILYYNRHSYSDSDTNNNNTETAVSVYS